MNAALIGQVGVLLGSIGAALQWLRAFKGFPEMAYYALVVLVTAGGCWLITDSATHVTRQFVLDSWPIYVTLFGVTLGGNAAVSNAAKGVVAKNPDAASNPLIPLTDSKG